MKAADIHYQHGTAEVWNLIGAQVRGEGITPMTALLAANLVPGEKNIPPSITIGSGEDYVITSVDRSEDVFDRSNPVNSPIDNAREGPVATIKFIPEGGDSKVFFEKIYSPVIEVSQTIPLHGTTSLDGTFYAPIITGGLIAASKIYPSFPLAPLMRA